MNQVEQIAQILNREKDELRAEVERLTRDNEKLKDELARRITTFPVNTKMEILTP